MTEPAKRLTHIPWPKRFKEDGNWWGIPACHGFVLYFGGKYSNQLHPASLALLGGVTGAMNYRAQLFRLHDNFMR